MKRHGVPGETVSFLGSRARMEEIWRYYIEKWAKYGDRVVWQFGLRGKADQAVWKADPNVPMDPASRGAIITDAIAAQYRIVSEVLGHTDFPSTATLWMEGAELYGQGYLQIPDDTIVVFSDIGFNQMMLCLSGQHEMVTDFSGFRNFFTLNFIAKPIYNTYILASRLGENLLSAEQDDENLFIVPTKTARGDYAILLTYSSEFFDEDIPARDETVTFAEDIRGKKVTVWCIDKETTNPYRLYQKLGIETPTEAELKLLREEGRLKPVREYVCGGEPLTLNLTPNATFLITVGTGE